MQADWYVDPLGRFDGRFFDGSEWTDRVSQNGSPAIDPDFPPATLDSASSLDEPQGLTEVSTAPAVVPVAPARRLQASLMEESPVRIVAVLDAGPVADTPAARNRAPIVWGLLGLIAALAVAAMLLWDRGPSDTSAEPVELDQAQEARVQDLEQGGDVEEIEPEMVEDLEVDAPAGTVDADATFDASETIEVGGLRILNGTSVLADLEAWHQDFIADRGITLDATSSCWFGQLGGAAVQVAHCGPVAGTDATEFVFDSVPLLFEQADGGQIAQPVVDAAVTDAVLANALTLVGNPDSPPPPSLSGG